MGLFDWLLGNKPKNTAPTFDAHVDQEEAAQVETELSPQEVKQKLDAGAPLVLLDVRELQELEICSLPNALHIPMGEIYDRYKEISEDPNAEIVVICHHGSRSHQVMHQLWGLGYQNAKNLAGGIHAWSLDVDPSVPRY